MLQEIQWGDSISLKQKSKTFMFHFLFPLSIDRIKEKYIKQVDKNEKDNFEENLKIINNQIKQIGNLVNEFSDFARMPKPILKKNDLIKIIHENIKLLSEIDSSIKINLHNKKPSILLKCDKEQISRVIFNLIKTLLKVSSKKLKIAVISIKLLLLKFLREITKSIL